MRRYGLLKLVPRDNDIILISNDAILLNEICNTKKVQQFIDTRIDDNQVKIRKNFRGHIKQALIKIGFPVEDLAGYEDGAHARHCQQKRHHQSEYLPKIRDY